MRPALLALAALLLPGCSLVFRAPTPMPAQVTTTPAAKCLVVFLPGFGDGPDVFRDHGFLDALAEHHLAVDTIAAGATFGYYTRRILFERLEKDVLEPAWRRKTYAETWLIGVSMGGLGALLTARDEPRITGLFLVAPYLGDDDVFAEIERAGGLDRWNPPAIAEGDYQRPLWSWLRGAVKDQARRPLYLGAGEKDHLGRGHRLLAAALPPDHVYRTPGGHDWGPWQALFHDFLDHAELTSRCTLHRD